MSKAWRCQNLLHLSWLLWLSGLLGSCQSFVPPETPPRPPLPEGAPDMGLHILKKKLTVRLKGRFEENLFHAERMAVKSPDHEVTIKGPLAAWTPGQGGRIGATPLFLQETTRLVDEKGEKLPESALRPGSFVKGESVYRSGRLILRKLTLRKRKPGEVSEIKGPLERIDIPAGFLWIGGVRVRFAPSVPVFWEVKGVPPPPPQERFLETTGGKGFGLARVRHLDPDEQLPDRLIRVGDFLSIGGSIRYSGQWRRNHNLQENRRLDRLLHDISGSLEFSFAFSRQVYAFSKVNLRQRIVHFDQGKNLDTRNIFKVEENYLLLEDLPLPGLSLQIGRQDFDDGREWVMDRNLDAVRLWANLDKAIMEFSFSASLYDADPDAKGVTNTLLGLHTEPFENQEFFFYYLHRKGGDVLDRNRYHLGVSGEGKLGPFSWWLDAGYATGREESVPLDGYGLDAALMYRARSLPGRPYVYAGYAFGSGDKHPGQGKDGNFRQTGLNDNNDRFGGVTSFHYLGELFRPDLFNIRVLTAGIGFRPFKKTSLDLVFHHYRQVEAAPFLGRSRLRRNPAGLSRDLGNEIDVILGILDTRPVQTEIVVSYFHPGSAFPAGSSGAWFATLQVKLKF